MKVCEKADRKCPRKIKVSGSNFKEIYYKLDKCFYSQKDSEYCDPTMNEMMTEIRPGQYYTTDGPFVDNCKCCDSCFNIYL